MSRGLVVDDEPAIARALEAVFLELDCDVDIVPAAEEGLKLAESNDYDVVLLDVRLPGMDGVQALPKFRAFTDAPIIVMTAFGSLNTAVSVVQEGAFEYLPKPFELQQVTDLLQRALSHAQQQRTGVAANVRPETASSAAMVGESLPMQHLFRQIALAAQHDAPVLITGASGTGKELVAKAIHQHSVRRKQPLVPVHLASLSDSLMERELFGHEAGAFTGADRAQAGVIAQADGGTLFLDEIGETPKDFQVKLLRLLESHEYYPVGSSTPRRSNFRLIAATNRGISFLRDEDHFRSDLFFRLATIQIHVPPLDEHLDDIPVLAQHFLAEYSGDDRRSFSEAALKQLQQRSYPGNVRELRNTVIQAAANSAEVCLGPQTLPVAPPLPRRDPSKQAGSSTGAGEDPDKALQAAVRRWVREQASAEKQDAALQQCLQTVEAELIRIALEQTGGNRTAAARMLGMHRETLRDRLNRQAKE